MTQKSGRNGPYEMYSGQNISVPDNNIHAPEFIIRDSLNHVFETGYTKGKRRDPFDTFASLLLGAAITLFFDGLCTWIAGSSPSWLFFFAIICLIVFLFLRKKGEDAQKDVSVFEMRDATVDTVIKNLAFRISSNPTGTNPEKQSDGSEC